MLKFPIQITEEERKAGLPEESFKKHLDDNGIEYMYQHKVPILSMENPEKPLTYNFDFIIETEEAVLLIETKGYHRNMETYLLKERLIKRFV